MVWSSFGWLVLGVIVGALFLAGIGWLIWFWIRKRKSHTAGSETERRNPTPVQTGGLSSKQEGKKEEDMVQNAGDQLGRWKRAVEERDALLAAAYKENAALKPYVAALAERDRLLQEAYAEIAQRDSVISGLEKKISDLGSPEEPPASTDAVGAAGAPKEEAKVGADQIAPPPAVPSRTPASAS